MLLLLPVAFLAACAHPQGGVTPATVGAPREASDESCLLSTGDVPGGGHAATVTIGLRHFVGIEFQSSPVREIVELRLVKSKRKARCIVATRKCL